MDLTGTIASTSSAVGAAVSVVDSSTSHTGSFTIDADQTLGSLDATGGELNVAANLTVLSGLTVQGATVLQGTNPSTTITLSNGSPVYWQSVASGQFLGMITGTGSVNVQSPSAGAALTLGSNGYTNGYSGGTNVSGGNLMHDGGSLASSIRAGGAGGTPRRRSRRTVARGKDPRLPVRDGDLASPKKSVVPA